MINIDVMDKRPIYEQVVEKLKKLIVKEILKEGDKLPSVRNLAMDLSINPNTIQKAYAELEKDGFIYTVKGRGNFVAKRDIWIDDTKDKVVLELKTSIKKALRVGIDKSEVENIIDDIYKEG